jgi:hypothetical protein
MTGDYILAVASKLLAQIRHEDVLVVLAQVLADLVRGEFQQLQNKSESSERFQLYLAKTFNKTASLIAYRYVYSSRPRNIIIKVTQPFLFLAIASFQGICFQGTCIQGTCFQ